MPSESALALARHISYDTHKFVTPQESQGIHCRVHHSEHLQQLHLAAYARREATVARIIMSSLDTLYELVIVILC